MIHAAIAARLVSAGDALVITSGQRLARACQQKLAEEATAAGISAWREPQIQTLEQWLTSVHQHWPLTAGDAPARALSRVQCAAVWAEICRQLLHDRQADFSGLNGLARQCAQAHELLVQWQLPETAIDNVPGNEDTAFFRMALTRFRQWQQREQWLAPYELGAWWLELDDARPNGPEHTFWVGFHRLTPLEQSIMEAQGAERVAEPSATVAGQRHRYATLDEELMAAGAWARQQLGTDCKRRVVIVVPDLSQRAELVQDRIAEGFDPTGAGLGASRRLQATFAPPLSDYPAVQQALQLFEFASNGLYFAGLSALLRSATLNRTNPAAALAAEHSLRAHSDQCWSADALQGWAEDFGHAIQWLPAIVELRANATDRHPISHWAGRFATFLVASGWHDAMQSASITFQMRAALLQTLNRMATLDSLLPPITLASAVAQLNSMAQEQAWQPEGGFASLLVAGPLELAGLEFDALWLANTDAARWPPSGEANPMLPYALQRASAMPDASAGQALFFWRSVHEQLLASADEVVVSDAEREGDSELLPSPLNLAPVVSASTPPQRGLTPLRGLVSCHAEVDTLRPFDPDRTARGGWRVLALQGTDPFGAMVYGRWAPATLEAPTLGVDARQRGILIHRALQYLFDEQPQDTVYGESGARLPRSALEAAVTRAFAREYVHADRLNRLLLRREEQRALEVIALCVAADEARPAFRILAHEQSRVGFYGGLPLSLRIDRIDQIGDELLVIDYKTGSMKERLRADPEKLLDSQVQLACYLAGPPPAFDGVALLPINPSSAQLQALISERVDLPWADETVSTEDFSALRQSLRKALAIRGQSFLQGDCQLNLVLKNNRDLWLPIAPISRLAEYGSA
ncbi:MAG: PD-(D/E)XK nuclease family protein [Pseudomonadota bacterium]